MDKVNNPIACQCFYMRLIPLLLYMRRSLEQEIHNYPEMSVARVRITAEGASNLAGFFFSH